MQLVEHKVVESIPTPCQYQPHELYNLWDMIAFLADGFIRIYDNLEYLMKCFANAEAGAQLNVDVQNTVQHEIWKLQRICKPLSLTASWSRCALINQRLYMSGVKGMDSPCETMKVELEGLLETMKTDLAQIQFAFIPQPKVQFFEQLELFGETVSAAFPSAQPEIKDAGNCLAADLHSAAVFHLMRTAEHGLRALARHLRVRVGQPLEYACWERVIQAINKKLAALRSKARGKKKSAELEFYGRLLMECAYFKDEWRNPVSHLRGRFSEGKALDAYGHVKDFMTKLSERVKETN